MNRKAQAAMEYLLAVGGVVFVAAIVILMVVSIPSDISMKERTSCLTHEEYSICEADPACIPIKSDGTVAANELEYVSCLG